MMDGNALSSDQVIRKLVQMGFEMLDAVEAVKAVGTSCDDAIEYILNGRYRHNQVASDSSGCSTRKSLGKRPMPSSCSSGQMRQSSLFDRFLSSSGNKQRRASDAPVASLSQLKALSFSLEEHEEPFIPMHSDAKPLPEILPRNHLEELNIGSNWESRVNFLLQSHFGFQLLKSFQKEALSAWVAHQDSLVLAATGSGKSLCFQMPALLTGKVVIVVSPLISLMHDQCLKLSEHGISACFLGSGQPDSTVEQKAMRGVYDIVYVCPETILRLMKPLQKLAETRGIALFAIDEVHCVSKWGHDFRPAYRRLSILRENFSASNLKFLQFDIPIMALTATATFHVREDIVDSLCMSKNSKVVLTTFFRPNLRFSVKHSKNSRSSYEKDFCQLIDFYVRNRKTTGKRQAFISQELDKQSDSASSSLFEVDNDDDEADSEGESGSTPSRGKEMSIEYLEKEADIFQSVDDWDVVCGEFCAKSPQQDWKGSMPFEVMDRPDDGRERLKLQKKDLEEGPTIIYVPTRKETLNISKYLSQFGVKAAAYHAMLPKSHLRKVHKEFHENLLEVVVATCAFGMGIDKPNVRRIIHYGWPQSLEAYYQEAGRAGRDGKLADCILYADLLRHPTLLPNRRSEEWKNQAYKMLSDCFRYGMNTSCCRAKILVEYFGEDFSHGKCHLCDVCINGPPEMLNVREDANILMQVIAAYHAQNSSMYRSCEDYGLTDGRQRKYRQNPHVKMLIRKIKEQWPKYIKTDQQWWRGLVRILENKGYVKEWDGKTRVEIKFPEPTNLGLNHFVPPSDQPLYVYPEADMLLSTKRRRPYSSFAEWGKGWADPKIRRQRLEIKRLEGKTRASRKPREGRSRKPSQHFSRNALLNSKNKWCPGL